MPWHPQVCPFCQTNYANKAGLHKHLRKFTGEWRIPSDGVHDVLKIHKIIYPGVNENVKQYKCPQCSKVISGKHPFINHVVYRVHYGGYYDNFLKGYKGRTQRGSWILPFDEKVALIPRRKGVFKFLHLPYELRHMIYEFALVYQKIEFQRDIQISLIDPGRQGIWLQRNAPRNPLALLSVNRQIYEEARRVFYGRNYFFFKTLQTIPVFLIGIGPENTKILRNVEAVNEFYQIENQVDLIRSSTTEEKEDGTATDIWTDDRVYGNFMYNLCPSALVDYSYADRLFRPDEDRETHNDARRRYCFDVHYFYPGCDESDGVERGLVKTGTASFELYGAI